MITVRFALAMLIVASLGASAQRVAAEEALPDMKSGSGAFLYSFLGIAIPTTAGVILASNQSSGDDGAAAALFLGGYLLGPSLGHFYAGRPGRAGAGIGIRTAALLGLTGAVALAWDNNDNPGAAALAFGSVVVGAGSTIMDIADASKSARIHNEKLRSTRLSITPAAIGATRAPGVRVDWTF